MWVTLARGTVLLFLAAMIIAWADSRRQKRRPRNPHRLSRRYDRLYS